MSTTIYVLRLAGGNWYVGKTDNFQKRMEEHVRGGGAGWTSKHKVIKVDKVVENASPFDEDRYVKEYMAKYGIDKVRGGSYVTEKLDSIAQASLKREIHAATDCCTRCGRNNHFVSDCYAKTDASGRTIQTSSNNVKKVKKRYYDDDSEESDDEYSDDGSEDDDYEDDGSECEDGGDYEDEY